jgi:hypothetical protein
MMVIMSHLCQTILIVEGRNTQIVILGDRHGRGYARKLKVYLTKTLNVTGFMKQEPDIPTLTVFANGAVEKLTFFFLGGTKHVGNNNTKEGLKHAALKMLGRIILMKG